MNLETLNIVIFILGIAIGLAAGLYIRKNKSQSVSTQSTGISVAALQQEIDRKQIIIDSFFEETNDTLTQTERLVSRLRNHLAAGASELSSTPVATSSQPEQKKAIDDNATFEPPRDYAPKSAGDDSPGMLSEEYGFAKDKRKENSEENSAL